jgi:NAD(P)-dependent dehydrogenase (short-subunit alcohol dehydrogenase family)
MATTELSGKVALVTGASSGIGLATCERLVELGARVAMVARTKSALDREAARLGSSRAGAFPLDVKDLGALAQLPARVVERFGRLDIVVNNAGLNHRGPAARERRPRHRRLRRPCARPSPAPDPRGARRQEQSRLPQTQRPLTEGRRFLIDRKISPPVLPSSL